MRRIVITAAVAAVFACLAEGVLVLCARAGSIGSCGPDSWQAFAGLFGNTPGILLAELFGIKAEGAAPALNGGLIAAFTCLPAWLFTSKRRLQNRTPDEPSSPKEIDRL